MVKLDILVLKGETALHTGLYKDYPSKDHTVFCYLDLSCFVW